MRAALLLLMPDSRIFSYWRGFLMLGPGLRPRGIGTTSWCRSAAWSTRCGSAGHTRPPGTEPGGGAERVGFEPTEDLRPHFLSREAASTGLGHLSPWEHASVARVPSAHERRRTWSARGWTGRAVAMSGQ